MEAEQIVSWCEETGVNSRNVIVLNNVPVDVTHEMLYQVRDNAGVFGRSKVRGRCLAPSKTSQLILVEVSKDINTVKLPEHVGVRGEVAPWLVSVAGEAPPLLIPTEKEDFQGKLMTFLANEGKTLADMKGQFNPVTPSPAAPDLSTQLVNAISSLVEKCQAAPVERQLYRKLHIFSGVKPTPQGEEEYEAWVEQATHMLDEWKCADSLKKQKIAESLKGPAADIVRCLRASNPNATANDYLTALETAFGTTESAADLMFKFHNMF